MSQNYSKNFAQDLRLTRSAVHQNNRLMEKFNKTLLHMLTKSIDSNQRNWDQYLQLVMLAYRSSVQESTGFSPAFLTFGREIEFPCDLLYGCGTSDTYYSHVPYI